MHLAVYTQEAEQAGMDDEQVKGQYSVSNALEHMSDDNESGHVVTSEETAKLAAELAKTRVKVPLAHKTVAQYIAPLATKCASMGKELHVLLLGCNTINTVTALKREIRPEEQKVVTVLCTSDLWPSDCSTMLWCLYGALVRTKDVNTFRAGTRNLLGEYTDHYARQRIMDESRAELKLTGSLANAVHCDRLSNIEVQESGDVVMQLL